MNDVELLMTYLSQGNLLGFLVACFTSRIGQWFYVLLTFFGTVPLYLRTQSVLYPALIWILIGGLFIQVMPMISPAAVVLIILGISVTILNFFVGRET